MLWKVRVFQYYVDSEYNLYIKKKYFHRQRVVLIFHPTVIEYWLEISHRNIVSFEVCRTSLVVEHTLCLLSS